jgi:hypothetical protein
VLGLKHHASAAVGMAAVDSTVGSWPECLEPHTEQLPYQIAREILEIGG